MTTFLANPAYTFAFGVLLSALVHTVGGDLWWLFGGCLVGIGLAEIRNRWL